MHGLPFEGATDHPPANTAIAGDLTGLNYVRYYIALYVTAAKYAVLSLRRAIAADLRGNLSILSGTQQHSLYVSMVAKRVYSKHTEAARPLWTRMIGVVGKSFERLDDRGW